MLIKNKPCRVGHLVFLLVLSLGAAAQTQAWRLHNQPWPPGTVTYIVDGDTFDMVDSACRLVRIRPIGIDADEMKDNVHGKKGPFAQATKNYLAKLILRKKVRIVTDIELV